ncbi:acyltransferase family protein [Patulibacter minatonensis]|uniref:acyltransferase family protein n=1 Tax=Patulibacter minatonensis TaxID=298163 RepID=UPI00047979C2|nr:acyltransferase family protein [Patulibacter minatonensis]
MPRETTRRPALDGLRALAAIGIVAHHSWQYSGHPREVLGIWWDELALGVPLFFVLSGFLVYAPWARAAVDPAARRPSLGRFYALRAARILPLYWLTIVAAVVLLHGTGHPRLVEDGRLLGFAVLAQNYSGDMAGMLNPPTWSLAVEVTFYAVVPLIGLLALLAVGLGDVLRGAWGPGGRRATTGDATVRPRPRHPLLTGLGVAPRTRATDRVRGGRRRTTLTNAGPSRGTARSRTRTSGRGPQLAVLLALTGASVGWSAWTGHNATSPVIRTVLPDVLCLFCVGMAARVLVEGRTVPRWAARTLLVAGVALVWAHGSGRLGAPLYGALGDLPAAVGFAAVCVACSTVHAPRPLGWRPLAYLGTCSYGIYLWHYPVLLGLQAHGLLPTDDVWLTTAAVGGPAILLAAASWHLFEQPLLRGVRGRLAGPARTRPTLAPGRPASASGRPASASGRPASASGRPASASGRPLPAPGRRTTRPVRPAA